MIKLCAFSHGVLFCDFPFRLEMSEALKRTFPPSSRLRKSKEFQRLRNATTKIHTNHFLVILEPSELMRSRIGITVSTKIDKTSVGRNRMKRLIREAFRLNRDRLRRYFDIVIIARKNAANCSFDEVQQELFGALMQKGFLINEKKAHS